MAEPQVWAGRRLQVTWTEFLFVLYLISQIGLPHLHNSNFIKKKKKRRTRHAWFRKLESGPVLRFILAPGRAKPFF